MALIHRAMDIRLKRLFLKTILLRYNILIMKNEWKTVEDVLKKGGVAVVPTDTLYGIVARADDKKAVERIYKIKGRNEKKPFIILITNTKDLEKFGVQKNFYQKHIEFFKPKTSVILPVPLKKFTYLHRGSNSLAFRMISKRNGHLYELIEKVGPIVAPSANPEGEVPAKNRREARKYFGDKIDAYICYGTRNGKPSTIISFVGGKKEIIRK